MTSQRTKTFQNKSFYFLFIYLWTKYIINKTTIFTWCGPNFTKSHLYSAHNYHICVPNYLYICIEILCPTTYLRIYNYVMVEYLKGGIRLFGPISLCSNNQVRNCFSKRSRKMLPNYVLHMWIKVIYNAQFVLRHISYLSHAELSIFRLRKPRDYSLLYLRALSSMSIFRNSIFYAYL